MTRSRILLCAQAVVFVLAACSTPDSLRQLTTRSVGPAPALVALERALRDDAPISTGDGRASVPVASRVAVIVGNRTYLAVPSLKNPANDAQAMSTVLGEHGFHVIQSIDADKRRFEKVLQDAVIEGGPYAESVFFYAGHGFQIADKNYLLPVDGALSDPYSLPYQTVTLENVFTILAARSDRQVSLLDACRNNPFETAQVAVGLEGRPGKPGAGFSNPPPPPGAFAGYSTSPGALAYDGESVQNSPYTTSLLLAIGPKPDMPLNNAMPQIRDAVAGSTKGAQVPTWQSALTRPFTLAANSAEPAIIELASTAAVPPVPPSEGSITLDAPLERRTALGMRLRSALNLGGDQQVTVTGRPVNGRIAAISTDHNLIDRDRIDVTASQLGSVVYVLSPDQRAAGTTGAIEEKFEVSVSDPDTRRAYDVTLRLAAHPCDVQAGDWLDPQGSTLYRAAGLIDGPEAISACLDDARRETRSGRFAYQLGRAYLASGDQGRAGQSFERARSLGHTRADIALGDLSQQAGDLASARASYERAMAAGDPVAYARLGDLLLTKGNSRAEQEAGYAYLDIAIDLGLPDAMRSLAGHYAKPGAVGYDPARSDRLAQGASSRRDRPTPGSFSAPAPSPSTETFATEDDNRDGGGGY